jgi:hypothetical protein
MTKINKRVEVVRAHYDHPPDKFYANGLPVLLKKPQLDGEVKMCVGKDVQSHTPRHECPEWATGDETPGFESATQESATTDGGTDVKTDVTEDGAVFRYDSRGDQICTRCGYIRNQDTEDVQRDHQHAGRYDGFSSE